MGFNVMEKDNLKILERPTTLLSGLAKGGSIAKLKIDVIQAFITRRADELQIDGRLEVTAIIPTVTGVIIKLLADDQAVAGLEKVDMTLKLGAAGNTKFQPFTEVPKEPQVPQEQILQKVELLEKQLAEQKRLLLARQADESKTVSEMELGSL